MEKGIIGKKIGMTQIFDETGNVIPVTVLEAGPCVVVQKKTEDAEGYLSVQLGYDDIAIKNVIKPKKGHFDKASVAPKRVLKEFKLVNANDLNVGDELKADVFAAGDKVDITGVSKGKGFAGTIKRHNGARLKMTHGTAPVHRSPGSIGACASPGKVIKGKKMPGHMGAEKVTVQNLEVIKIDAEKNLIIVKGAVPGPKNGVIYVKSSVKNA